MEQIKKNIKGYAGYALLSFLIPVAVLAVNYWLKDIYPGSNITILASDSFTQYSHFHASFHNLLKGDGSVFYTWYGSLGLNYWAFIGYYLGGIFTPLVYFFDNLHMADTLYYLTLLKFGCIGLSFWYFAYKTFRIPKWGHLILSNFYALMSFTIAFSEIIMWLDAIMYLPLVILGIHRVMDERKPLLLFVTYLLVFLSNFYMGFIVGLFTFLYYMARVLTDRQKYGKSLPMYLLTSILAGGGSMVMILPTVLDLSNNGEELTRVTSLKTSATGPLDMIVKNMIGVYDTTQFDGIPFVYIGLLPLIFCLFFFVSKKFPLKNKLIYGALIGTVTFSFYFEPLNLLWQGMHAPNMFLFRYSFVFSFMVILLAGYGWEKYSSEDFELTANIFLGVIGLFVAAKIISDIQGNEYLNGWSLIYSLIYLGLYLTVFFLRKQKLLVKLLPVALYVIVCGEVYFNTQLLIQGISNEWTYPSRNHYEEPYPDKKKLVDQTKEENDSFYRTESLSKLSENESFNYGYSGLSMFSSIRNRNSSYYLADLGFRSWNTQLTVRYNNNTILMDSLLGIKYNLSKQDPLKFGYSLKETSGEYQLYENEYALPLGMLTDEGIYEEGVAGNQAKLLNYLADTSESYFDFVVPELINTENAEVVETKSGNNTLMTITSEEKEEAKKDSDTEQKKMVLTWQVEIPAKQQAYFTIYPTNYDLLAEGKAEINVGDISYETSIAPTGQYYNVGYYEEKTVLTFTTAFSNTDTIEMVKPDIVLLDTPSFEKSVNAIQKKGVDIKVDGRRAEAQVTAEKDQVLLTTIPYDKGWKVYVDGKEAEIQDFKGAFLSISLTAGEHDVSFVFLPYGLKLGTGLSIFSFVGFGGYWFYLKRKKRKNS